ncbi:hypothetical protein FVEG_06861 [Fusarium verticillioides 7600]|uniref:Uncharacterized protein n=1 Tax=Gibberella moniliformis (strain M3125 / FGSC 7600) TaxID=334819 RepID=W7M453_GIBM7|nr:hypothetical protein FVEG_06861 [Fusarium verticillioides 7600]EWG46333.1 hypothetical protein FVEG_06861 [Fusarium verticillioides 7600]
MTAETVNRGARKGTQKTPSRDHQRARAFGAFEGARNGEVVGTTRAWRRKFGAVEATQVEVLGSSRETSSYPTASSPGMSSERERQKVVIGDCKSSRGVVTFQSSITWPSQRWQQCGLGAAAFHSLEQRRACLSGAMIDQGTQGSRRSTSVLKSQGLPPVRAPNERYCVFVFVHGDSVDDQYWI